jgi:MFS family permease
MMPRQQFLNLLAAIAAVTVFGFTLGLMFPLLALIMEKQGVAPDVIGYNTAMQPLGIVLSVFFIPIALHHFGAKATAIGCAAATALVILAYPFAPVFWWWFGLRILHGFFVATLFAISEAWIVRFAEGPWRSRLLAVYTSVLSLSFGSGPSIIAIVGIEGVLPFAIGSVVLALAIIPILFVRNADVDEEDERPPSVFRFVGRAPVLILGVFAFAVIDAAFLGFLSVYAVKKGMGTELAALCLTIFIVGNTVLQFPIGWLADHYNKRILLAASVLGTAAMAALLPMSFGTALLWPVLAIGGAASAAIYTISLAELGEQFSGHDLTVGTACFSMTWGAGALTGALGTGWAFDTFGPDGMPAFLALFLAAAFILIAITLPRHLHEAARREMTVP